MAGNYKHSGKKFAVVTSSGAIVSGALCYQEGIFGVSVNTLSTGESGILDTKGVWNVAVPASTVKGDKMWAALVGVTDQTSITLIRGAGSSTQSLVGIARSDRDSLGFADVQLAHAPFFALP